MTLTEFQQQASEQKQSKADWYLDCFNGCPDFGISHVLLARQMFLNSLLCITNHQECSTHRTDFHLLWCQLVRVTLHSQQQTKQNEQWPQIPNNCKQTE